MLCEQRKEPTRQNKVEPSLHLRSGKARYSAVLTVKYSKVQSWRLWDIILITNTGKPINYSGESSSVFAATNRNIVRFIKTKILSYSAMRRASLADGESFSNII